MSEFQFWLTLLLPAAVSIGGIFIATWTTTQKLQDQLAQDRANNQAKFDALTIRVGNQDALINSISVMSSRLDERMKAMSETNAQITIRRDQQFDELGKTLDLMREESAAGRERDARLETKLDGILDAMDARVPTQRR